jgi:hypothetical protein
MSTLLATSSPTTMPSTVHGSTATAVFIDRNIPVPAGNNRSRMDAYNWVHRLTDGDSIAFASKQHSVTAVSAVRRYRPGVFSTKTRKLDETSGMVRTWFIEQERV